jgi:hypothetical protein
MPPPNDPDVQADPGAIRATGQILEHDTAPYLEQAQQKLQQTRAIEHSNFTSVTPLLATMYVAAVEFVEEELKSKLAHLSEIHRRMDKTAAQWEQADQKSTITVR